MSMMVYAPSLPGLPFRRAHHYAQKIAEWIAPCCLQIEPVGPIRRQCPTCPAVELLVIPKVLDGKYFLFDFLDDYVRQSKSRAYWEHPSALDLRGPKPSPDVLDARVTLPKCTLAIHCATPETWFLRLFETTGSDEHCIGIKQEVERLDGQWYRGKFISIANRDVVPKSEGEIYDLVKLPFVPPRKRTN
jgi:hypothetical protein